jgi:GNAT superfamily N-acetyltransferase
VPALIANRPEYSIRETDEDVIWRYVVLARRERLTVSHLDEVYGAFGDGRLLGFGGIVFYKRHAKLKTFWVRPEYRGRGIGTALLERRLERCRELGMEYVTATVTRHSVRMYLRRGATITKRYRNHHRVRLEL